MVQTESRTSNLFECFDEVQPIFCKDIVYLLYFQGFCHELKPSATQHCTILNRRHSREQLLTQKSKLKIQTGIRSCFAMPQILFRSDYAVLYRCP